MIGESHSDAHRRLVDERAATTERIARLERSFEGIVAATAGTATDDEHDPEGHTIAWERQQIASLLQLARDKLNDIDEALDRQQSGRYGTCETCGQTISDDRLAAVPATSVCVGCAGSQR